jgi:phosphatidylglycerophosphatase A
MIPRMAADQATAAGARSGVLDRLATLLATGLGCGYAPVAPGTVGSLLGLALYWPLTRLALPARLAGLAALILAGTAAATLVARRLGDEDPGVVVVDEVAGMWVTLLFLPLTPLTATAGFFLFRVMDVFKPFPARSLERLPGGWGVMADDLMAGVYANLAVRLLLVVWPHA